MDWVAIKIGMALIGAGNTILDKKLATRPNTPPLLHAASFGLVSVPVALIGLCLLPPIPLPMALSGILGGILFMIAVWLYYGVMAKEEVSQVTLLMRLTGIQTMILSALFLDERLTVMQHAAFVIGTVGGVLRSAWQSWHSSEPSCGHDLIDYQLVGDGKHLAHAYLSNPFSLDGHRVG